MKGSKKGVPVAAELLSFQYERPVQYHYDSHSSSYHKPHRARKNVSSLHLMQTSLKFVVDPFLDPKDECLYDPDVPVPWQHVASIVVNVDDEHSLSCPICLSYARVPKISKCGHTYCYSCILRHMEGSIDQGSKYFKCPMCSFLLSQSDLRPVKFITRKNPERGKMFEFQLLRVLAEEAITPTCIPATNGPDDVSSVPISISNTSNLKVSSLEDMENMFEGELDDLVQFRQECMSAGESMIDMIVPKTILELQDSSSTDGLIASSPTTGNIWLDRMEQQHQLSKPQSKKPSVVSISYLENDGSNAADVEYIPYISHAIDLAEERKKLYLQRANKLSSFVARKLRLPSHLRKKTVDVEDIDHSDSHARDCFYSDDELNVDELNKSITSTRTSSSPQKPSKAPSIEKRVRSGSVGESSSSQGKSGLSDVSKDAITPGEYFYQSIDGGSIFLHPICLKCMLMQYPVQTSSSSTSSTAARLSGGADTVSSMTGALPLSLPSVLNAKIIDTETFRLTSNVKRKHPFLRHLPEDRSITFVEIDMKSLISKDILALFSNELSKREQKRRDLDRKMSKEKKIDERIRREEERSVEVRKLQIQQSNTARLNDLQSFVGHSLTQDKSYEEYFPPPITSDVPNPSQPAAADARPKSSVPYKSFSKVAQMGGEFPSLNEVTGSASKSNPWKRGESVPGKQQTNVEIGKMNSDNSSSTDDRTARNSSDGMMMSEMNESASSSIAAEEGDRRSAKKSITKSPQLSSSWSSAVKIISESSLEKASPKVTEKRPIRTPNSHETRQSQTHKYVDTSSNSHAWRRELFSSNTASAPAQDNRSTKPKQTKRGVSILSNASARDYGK